MEQARRESGMHTAPEESIKLAIEREKMASLAAVVQGLEKYKDTKKKLRPAVNAMENEPCLQVDMAHFPCFIKTFVPLFPVWRRGFFQLGYIFFI